MRRHQETKHKGKQRKKHGGDCGHPRCQLCHSDKFPRRIPTQAEVKADLKLKEQRPG